LFTRSQSTTRMPPISVAWQNPAFRGRARAHRADAQPWRWARMMASTRAASSSGQMATSLPSLAM
jgi:hypothetical protein